MARRCSISFSSPMRTRIGSASAVPISLSSTTSSSSASRIGPDRAGEVEHAGPGQVGRAGQRDPLVGPLDQRLQQHRRQRRHRPAAAPARPRRPAPATSGGVSARRRPSSFSLISVRSAATSASAIGPGSSTMRCSTRPVSVIITSISRVVEIATSSRWRTDGPGQARVLHDRDLAGDLGEQPHRAVHHVVEVDGADQEALDRAALGRRERLDPGELVDEQPVAAVGRHPAGARVRLAEVALFLQHGHVVAHGGRGDPQLVALDEGLAADRLLGGDIVLDDRAQHVELAVVEDSIVALLVVGRRSSATSVGTSRRPECQVYGCRPSGDASAAKRDRRSGELALQSSECQSTSARTASR